MPAGYVTGHETAIVNFVNRGIARPMTQPPRVSERGIGRRPTLVSNAETLAHVALIARHGAEWFREIGPSDEPGSALVTLSGGVRAPGVYEIAHGSRLASLVRAAGGLTEPVRAFLLGGYAGTWIDAAAATALGLSRRSLRPLGAALGAGVIVVAAPERLSGRRGNPRGGVDGRRKRIAVRAVRQRVGRDRRHVGRRGRRRRGA